jgi:hypothetical protein
MCSNCKAYAACVVALDSCVANSLTVRLTWVLLNAGAGMLAWRTAMLGTLRYLELRWKTSAAVLMWRTRGRREGQRIRHDNSRLSVEGGEVLRRHSHDRSSTTMRTSQSHVLNLTVILFVRATVECGFTNDILLPLAV